MELVNSDENDKARTAEVIATSENTEKGGYAKNVVNGKLRSYKNECNAWISKSELPQSIYLKWDEAVDISMVQITAETDLAYPMYSFQDAPHFGYTVQDLTVELYRNGICVDKREIIDNFRRQMRLNFSVIKADEVKITVNKTSGEDVAILNEIRVY